MFPALKRIIRTAVCCAMACGMAGCDIDDDSDLCCDRVVMEYCYHRDGEDAFRENILSLRHFLFDGDKRFIREVPQSRSMRLQKLDSLATGEYTMVTVGNSTGITQLKTPAHGSALNDFMLGVEDDEGANTDPLYYGICPFTLTREDITRQRHFVTNLANVHCRLKVTVKWQYLPPELTSKPAYRLTLSDCALGYALDGKDGYSLNVKRFPHSPEHGREHRADLPLDGRQLKTELVSLRYTTDNLPALQVFHRRTDGGYEELTPALDLGRAFRSWGYTPESVECQEYKILVTIYADGHTGIKVEGVAGIADWVDGGSFS